MGRIRHTRMKILDLKVVQTKDLGEVCAVSVEIRRGKYSWTKAYAVKKEELSTFTFDGFKERVYRDAMKLVEKQEFEEKAIKQIEDVMGVEIQLD